MKTIAKYGVSLSARMLKRLLATLALLLAADGVYAQDRTIEADVPFEVRAPWFKNPTTRSELVDEVLLTGTLKMTMRIWQSSPERIDRFALNANAVDIKGTSETTGQRYKVNGSFNYDLRNPEVTFNPDGTFTVPEQPFTLRMHMVDPEPARLSQGLAGSTGATMPAVFTPPPPPAPCRRIFTPDGTATATVDCGNVRFTYISPPIPLLYRIVSSGGSACTFGVVCPVPDGATLFNGYTGGYDTPLFMHVRAPLWTDFAMPRASSARIFCQTGNRAPIVGGPIVLSGGQFISSCRPIYSATEPIKVWGEITYRYVLDSSAQERTLLVSERAFTFHMDERPADQAPSIGEFSVSAVSRIDGRCAIGQVCELNDGDIIFNTQAGDYERNLFLSVTASDPEGDPILVDWFCKSGFGFAPITDKASGTARCTPDYTYPGAIEVFARVSDGNNVTWTVHRLLYMLAFIF